MKHFIGIIETKMFILAFLEYLIFSSKIIFWFYTKNLTCRVLKILCQKCIVLKFLNSKFQLLNLRKWWFYKGLKPCHYLWNTLYVLNIHILPTTLYCFILFKPTLHLNQIKCLFWFSLKGNEKSPAGRDCWKAKKIISQRFRNISLRFNG